jgi:hypothetical protein
VTYNQPYVMDRGDHTERPVPRALQLGYLGLVFGAQYTYQLFHITAAIQRPSWKRTQLGPQTDP